MIKEILCTLYLVPANVLVDLGKKEAAAESPVSFFSDFFTSIHYIAQNYIAQPAELLFGIFSNLNQYHE